MKRSLSILFLSLVAIACGPSGNYQQPYYEQQPVFVPAPIVVPMTPHQPIMMPNTVTTTRRTTTVSPVQVQSAQPSATMQRSQYQQAVAPATQNLNDRAGQARAFQVQQGTQPKASGFGARPATVSAPKPSFSAPTPRPTTQFRKPTR